jgi:hypothetical protein
MHGPCVDSLVPSRTLNKLKARYYLLLYCIYSYFAMSDQDETPLDDNPALAPSSPAQTLIRTEPVSPCSPVARRQLPRPVGLPALMSTVSIFLSVLLQIYFEIASCRKLWLPAIQLKPLFKPNPSHLAVLLLIVNFLSLSASTLWHIM